ncbi:cyclophilin-like fold protein [Maridesulfovibrio sp. FT414]|uniref:cyclophilin-like fold protein n=1 Tax=Maridesulfovibrio sp. FT414 TaxID=2979469 RepID=UPI003D8062D9
MNIVIGRILPLLFLGLIFCAFILFKTVHVQATERAMESSNGLPLSDMRIQITSNGNAASFRLYDTDAARQLYGQLPLSLELSNFRDAQWMFYPPEKLDVTEREAYHGGKKGELSYYAPWGDVFMLYKDFHAGDEMHRLGIGLSGIDQIAGMSGKAVIQKINPDESTGEAAMQIKVHADGQEIVFELNDSQAAKDLYAQLPMKINVENYSSNEKIFYPPKKLGTGNTPLVKSARTGTLAYYAPWGDVVMFYGSFGSASGLYELGNAVQGSEHIRKLAGTIKIEK